MALDSSEDFENLSLNYEEIIHLQAIFRGALVRRQFNDLRKQYRSIVCDLEETDQCEVIWPSKHLAPPIVRRKRLKKKKSSIPCNKMNEKDQYTKITQQQCDIPIKENPPETTKDDRVGVVSDVSIQTGASLELMEQSADNNPNKDSDEAKSNDAEISKDENTGETQLKMSMNAPQTVKQNEIETHKIMDDVDKFEPPTHDSPQHLLKDVGESQTADLNPERSQGASNPSKNNENTEKAQPKVTFNDTSLMQDTHIDLSKDSINQGQPFASSTPKHVVALNTKQEEAAPIHNPVDENKDPPMRSSVLAIDGTSVWDTISFEVTTYPKDRVQLEQLRSNIAMELLWVQQAISSRKNYLRLKNKMSGK